jgi:hypothetical protein
MADARSGRLPRYGAGFARRSFSLRRARGKRKPVLSEPILAGAGVWCLVSIPAAFVVGKFLRRCAAAQMVHPSASVTRLPLERRVAAR